MATIKMNAYQANKKFNVEGVELVKTPWNPTQDFNCGYFTVLNAPKSTGLTRGDVGYVERIWDFIKNPSLDSVSWY